MFILLLREGNFQVFVILKWEMDYVDFCFLPNKCYHGISSSCSKLLMSFQTEISSFTCNNNNFTSSILTKALFPTKWDMSWIIHCSIQLTIILRSYCLLGLHDRIVALNSPYVLRASVNNRPVMLRLLLPRFHWVTDLAWKTNEHMLTLSHPAVLFTSEWGKNPPQQAINGVNYPTKNTVQNKNKLKKAHNIVHTPIKHCHWVAEDKTHS